MSDESRGSDGPADGDYVAVLDRFEGDLAVLLLEADEETVGDVSISVERLPEAAHHTDAVLHVTVEDGDLVDARYDEDETEARADRVQSRFDRLSRRLGDGDDEHREDDASR
ncbi:DUF3006 domain-containing protein [Halomarina salina]|uniref:DUF3006 domain-containing protein n=1 Tax=Halomarina salina TaxID=1872699 RepID=A0ABD5RR62_9EURY|nr:DUF3006 domain-containing protein [Halomarina salina]